MSRKERKEAARLMLESKVKLTPDARDWVTLAVDPYHDFQHQVAGYPDADSSSTVVSCYNYAMDISAPIGCVGNWDAHVFNLPRLTTTSYSVSPVQANGLRLANTINTVQLSFLNAMTANSGTHLFPDTAAWTVVNNFQTACIQVPDDGQSRVIGAAFEITNTTAEMYKQGMITAYKMPQNGGITNLPLQTVGPASLAQLTAMQYRTPPATASQAMLLGGSRQWAAKDGAYVVMSQSCVENPIVPQVRVNAIFAPDASIDMGDPVLVETMNAIESAANAPPALSHFAPPKVKLVPFNTSGVFLTGLSNQTTLRVTMKVYIEKAPTFTEPDLAVLATPSAPYDDRALKLYSAMWGQLPIGVPVGENGFGDWWKRIMKVVSAVAAPLGLATGNPAVGTAISAASGALSTVFEAKKVDKPLVNKAIAKAKRVANDTKPRLQTAPVTKVVRRRRNKKSAA